MLLPTFTRGRSWHGGRPLVPCLRRHRRRVRAIVARQPMHWECLTGASPAALSASGKREGTTQIAIPQGNVGAQTVVIASHLGAGCFTCKHNHAKLDCPGGKDTHGDTHMFGVGPDGWRLKFPPPMWRLFGEHIVWAYACSHLGRSDLPRPGDPLLPPRLGLHQPQLRRPAGLHVARHRRHRSQS